MSFAYPCITVTTIYLKFLYESNPFNRYKLFHRVNFIPIPLKKKQLNLQQIEYA